VRTNLDRKYGWEKGSSSRGTKERDALFLEVETASVRKKCAIGLEEGGG